MTIPLTLTQHQVLAHLSDGEARTGYDLDAQPAVLSLIQSLGYIDTDDRGPLSERYWHITPAGLAALDAVV